MSDDEKIYGSLDILDSTKCLKKALQKILIEISYDEFMKEIEHGDYSRFPHATHYLFEKFFDRKRPKPLYVFITLNLKDDNYFNSFQSCIEKSVTKKWIEWYMYAYEQRSTEGSEFTGYHVHMLLCRGRKSPSEVKREFQLTFRQLINVGNHHCLNFKFICKDHIHQKIDYILGEKQSKKAALCDRDVEMRKLNDLEDHYCSEFSPCPCRNSKNEEEIDSQLPSDIPETLDALWSAEKLPQKLSEEASTSSFVSPSRSPRDGIEST